MSPALSNGGAKLALTKPGWDERDGFLFEVERRHLTEAHQKLRFLLGFVWGNLSTQL